MCGSPPPREIENKKIAEDDGGREFSLELVHEDGPL